LNTIDRLLSNYSKQVHLPWSPRMSGKQRVWFAVYPPTEERRIRARLSQFEVATRAAQHGWSQVDLTRILPEWLSAHPYRDAIFQEPEYFTWTDELEVLAADAVKGGCQVDEADESSVVAIIGLASVFDFVRVSSLIDRVEDSVRGRLLVFFPGEYQHNTYRFMDARDGFNYMAVPITSTESFLNL
jgi:hypothetical protein